MRLYVTQGSGNSFKPVLALSQTSKCCDLTFVDVVGGETRGPAFKAINPAGTVPYLEIMRPLGLGESNAILCYLTEGTSLAPKSAYDRAKALQWMFFEQTALEPFISPARYFTSIVPHLAEEHRDEIPVWQNKANQGLRFLDTHLKGTRFVASDTYGIADIAVFGYTHLAAEAGINLDDYPAVKAWIERVEATDGYRPISDLLNPGLTALQGG